MKKGDLSKPQREALKMLDKSGACRTTVRTIPSMDYIAGTTMAALIKRGYAKRIPPGPGSASESFYGITNEGRQALRGEPS